MIQTIFENLFKPASNDDLEARVSKMQEAAHKKYDELIVNASPDQRDSADALLNAATETGNYLVDVTDHTSYTGQWLINLEFASLDGGGVYVYPDGRYSFGGELFEADELASVMYVLDNGL